MENSKNLELLKNYYDLSNYLCVKAMQLKNPCKKIEEIDFCDLKEKVSGHWGNASQINFIYSNLSYFSKRVSKDVNLLIGTGHSGLPLLINQFLDGTLKKFYKDLNLTSLLANFGGKNGFRSEINPEYPNVFYNGGELGYSLAVAYGFALKNKNLVFCVVGDGEAETGTASSSWMLNKLLNEKMEGVVVPILNLNKFKMGGKSFFSMLNKSEIRAYFTAFGFVPYFVKSNFKNFQNVLDKVNEFLEKRLFEKGLKTPLLVLEMEKGETAPDFEDIKIANQESSHKNPLFNIKDERKKLEYLKFWLSSYDVSKLIDEENNILVDFSKILPENQINSTQSAKIAKLTENSKTANLLKNTSNIADENSKISKICEEVYSSNYSSKDCLDELFMKFCENDLLFVLSPDELKSNKFFKTSKSKNHFEILNENICQGLMQGLLAQKKQCIMNSYEAFMPIISGMFDQYAKWIYQRKNTSFCEDLPSLNFLLTSNCWENCYSHQNPAFLNNALSKTYDFVNLLFPVDKNTKILAMKQVLSTFNKINIITVSKSLNLSVFEQNESEFLVENGYLLFNKPKNPKISILITGDYMLKVCLEIFEKLKQTHLDEFVNFVYVYNLNVLKNEKFVSAFKSTYNLYFFHGYESLLKSLLYQKLNIDKFFAFRDAVSRGSLDEKLKDNGICVDEIVEFLNLKVNDDKIGVI